MRDELKERVRRLIVLHITSSGYTVDELTDAAIALIRAETLEEAAKEVERITYLEKHPIAAAIRALVTPNSQKGGNG